MDNGSRQKLIIGRILLLNEVGFILILEYNPLNLMLMLLLALIRCHIYLFLFGFYLSFSEGIVPFPLQIFGSWASFFVE
jgi:hypothetical protein